MKSSIRCYYSDLREIAHNKNLIISCVVSIVPSRKISLIKCGSTEPRIICADQHQIDETHISQGAISVVSTLFDAGFEAYLVGGCVRDLLLGITPKDFDITTNANPEEIKNVFRRARLIGRRFRLAHVRIGREVLEVATYRSGVSISGDEQHSVSDSGRLLRDNIYGTREQDVMRRDFTANALFYHCARHTVIDYLGGYDDIRNQTLRIIGKAETRYREDPVRMLRAIRFSSKLSFAMEADTADTIPTLAEHIRETPPARLFDEILKLFHQGYASKTVDLMHKMGLFRCLFPQTFESLPKAKGVYQRLLNEGLKNTDSRVRESKPVIPAFLFAVVLWGPLHGRRQFWLERKLQRQDAFYKAANEVIATQNNLISIPRRVSVQILEIWEMQWRLEHIKARNVHRCFNHKRFRAAYDFLLLRTKAGEEVAEPADWWTRFQEVDDNSRTDMLRTIGSGAKKRRRPTRRKKSKNAPLPLQQNTVKQ